MGDSWSNLPVICIFYVNESQTTKLAPLTTIPFHYSDSLLPEARIKIIKDKEWILKRFINTEGIFWDSLLEQQVITNEEKQIIQVSLIK